ncbi:two-component system regulatory protein YycI [Gracilibacillus sp. YIM 98692]|uniref:two-component system regulatory protein YycI n=1 Tax=Gracilibacillus sp. YIM 98692 TaxID=2663532 RepID=UPI0013CFF992|nr:two-component system regulatory protein YycI [Gracilibacillus sp. YIM 98692]
MQWGQIKTLFIFCFLILDIFLLHQFINNQESELPFLPEYSREDNLRTNINGLEEIPEEPTSAEMLYAQRKEIFEETMGEIGELPNQNPIVVDDHLIISTLDEPVEMEVEGSMETLEDHIWNGQAYTYYGKDEKSNTLIFFQELEHPIFFNQSGVLLVQLNEDGDMIRYVQTALEEAEEKPEEEDLIRSIDAVSTLYYNGKLLSGDEVTDVAIGYHNLLPLPNGVQVLTPTWEIEVNEDKYFFVNAIEGHFASRDKNDFVIEMVEDQVVDYLGDHTEAEIESVNEDWEQEDLEEYVEQIIENLELSIGVE